MKYINCLLFFIAFNASSMERQEAVSPRSSSRSVQDLQILTLEKAQQLTTHEQEQQLTAVAHKYPHADIHYYRFLMQKPKGQMTVSEVHMRSFLAYFLKNMNYFDSQKIPFKEMVNTFFDIYAADGLENPNNFFHQKQFLQGMVEQILKEEQKHQHKFTFFTGMHHHRAFIMDILKELRAQLTNQPISYGTIWKSNSDTPQTLQEHLDLHITKATQALQRELNQSIKVDTGASLSNHNAGTLIGQLLAGENMLHVDEEVRNQTFCTLGNSLRFGLHHNSMLSTNFALFGNNGYSLEYTFRFFIENISYRHCYINNCYTEPSIEKLKTLLVPLIQIFEDLNVDQDSLSTLVEDFFTLYKKHFPDQAVTGGRLLTISINPDIVEKVAYIGAHIPSPLAYSNMKLSNPAHLLPLLKENPTLCELLLRRYRTRCGNKQIIPTSIYSSKKAQMKSKQCIKRGIISEKTRALSHPELEINKLFSCFFIDPSYVYDTDKIHIQCHDLFFKDERQQSDYYSDIKKLVTRYLSSRTDQNKKD